MNLTVITAQGPRTLPAQPGQPLLDALRDAAGLAPQAPCGGRGTCKKCTVYLLEDGCLRKEPVAARGTLF